MAPKQTDPQFKLRMTPEIKEAIELSAAANGRSMNAEILSRLEESFDPNAADPERLRFFEGMYDQLTNERAELYETINKQDLFMQQVQRDHRSFNILAKAIAAAILAEGDKAASLEAMAKMLATLEDDDTSDRSEEIPKQPWEY